MAGGIPAGAGTGGEGSVAPLTGPVYVENPNTYRDRYGLFSVVGDLLDLPVHARTGGLHYETGACEAPVGYQVQCATAEKDFGAGPSLIEGMPFMVIASETCSLVGMDATRAERIVRQRLTTGEQAQVEDAFSRGAFGQSPSLANNLDNVTLTPSVFSLASAISELEEWLYTTMAYGPAGVIHIPLMAAAYVGLDVTVRRDSAGVWRTALGTAVVFGNYSGLAPDGSEPDAGHTTLYITGPVSVWRTPDSGVFVSPYGQAVNKATNQFFMVAEREYVVTFDCHVAGIDVDLSDVGVVV